MWKERMKSGMISGLLLLTVVNVSAQDSTFTEMDSVMVVGTKTSQLQKEQATYDFRIDAKTITRESAQTTADLLQESGQIMVQKSQQGGGSPVLRGFEANKVLIVVDGIRLNNLIFRGGHLQNIISIDPLALQNIDVVMGQGSTLYGSDALGGVIQLETLPTPIFKRGNNHHLRAFTKYASANHGINTHFDYGYAAQRWSSLTSISYSKYGDLRMGGREGRYANNRTRPYYISPGGTGNDIYELNDNPLKQRQSGYDQVDLMQKFSFSHKNGGRSLVNLQYSESSDIPRYDRLTDTRRDSLRYAEWYYGPQVRLLAAYDFDKTWSSRNLTSHTTIGFQNLKESRYKRDYLSTNRSSNEENVNVYSLLSYLNKKLQRGYYQAGIDINYGSVKSVGYNLNVQDRSRSFYSSRYPNGKNYQLNTALYFLRHWNLTNTSFFNLGLRGGYSTLNSSILPGTPNPYLLKDFHQNNWIYSFDMSFKKYLSSQWKLSANLGTGYRIPNLDDLSKIFDSAPGILIVPNTNLKPEQTINLNLNVSYEEAEAMKWSFSPFVSRMFDVIATRAFTLENQDSVMYDGILSAVMANQNFNSAWLYGFNTQMSAELLPYLDIYTRLSYTYGQLTTKEGEKSPLDHISPVVGKVGLRYERKTWEMEVYSFFNGWKKLDRYSDSGEDNLKYAPTDAAENPQGMPRWQTLNVSSSIDLSHSWTLNLGLQNITDLRYQVFASGIVAPGRNAFISLLWKNQ